MQIYDTLMGIGNREDNIEIIAQYILSDTEIDAYAKSIMYVAKKQDKTVLDIIEQVIKRVFFGNNSEVMKKLMSNLETIKIIENVRNSLMERIKQYYPTFKEKWL